VAAEDYGQLVERENINREEAGVDASGMEAAIAALVIGDSSPEDRHPEKCVSCLAACAVHWNCASCKHLGIMWEAIMFNNWFWGMGRV